jgi:hypothetical protein
MKQLDRVTAEGLGLHVVEVQFPILTKAANASVGSPLRFQDWLCLLTAEERG